jgi:hypothetical protein
VCIWLYCFKTPKPTPFTWYVLLALTRSPFTWYVLLALTRSPFTGLDKPVGLHEIEASRISRQSAHGGEKVSRTHRPPLPPRRYSRYSFLLAAVSTPGPQCGRMKNPKDSTGNGTRDLPFIVINSDYFQSVYRLVSFMDKWWVSGAGGRNLSHKYLLASEALESYQLVSDLRSAASGDICSDIACN